MDLRDITPVPIGQDGPWFPGLVRAFLLRAQFDRAAARTLGWRGIRPSLAFGDSLTCRVAGPPGVFGLLLEQEAEEAGEGLDGSRLRGTFSLHYFPRPEERRTEMFPLAAAALAARPDYWDLVREFPARPDTRSLFQIAELRLAVPASGLGLVLGLHGLSRRRVVAVDGVGLDPGRFAVRPGGLESDVPAWGLAFPFFRTLAATVTRGLGEAPAGSRLDVRPGRVATFTADGQWDRREDDAVRLLGLELGYGTCAGSSAGSRPGPFRSQAWTRAHLRSWPGREASGPSRQARPELLVLTGFLGAGKTTLLRRFVEYNLQRDRFVAVIQNEAGEVGLDGRLLDGECRVVEVDEGCVCCSLSGRLRHGLAQVMERFDPDVVVLETSGLANPGNLLAELDQLRDLVRPGAVATVADAASVERALAESAVARAQVEAADILVLNKTDLPGPGGTARVRARLAALNPGMLLVEAVHGDIPFGLLCDPEPAPGRRAAPGVLPRYGETRPAQGPTHVADGFRPLTLRLDGPVQPDRLDAFLRDAGGAFFRLKGIVDVAGRDHPCLVQGVAGRVEVSPLPEPGTDERFLVLIGRGRPEDAAGLRRALLGT